VCQLRGMNDDVVDINKLSTHRDYTFLIATP